MSILQSVTNRRDSRWSLPTMQSIRTKNKSTLQKTITIHIITTNSPNPKKRYHNNTTQKDYHLMNTDSEYKHKTIQSYPSISNQSTIDWRNFIRGRISQVFYPQSKKYYKQKKTGHECSPPSSDSIDWLPSPWRSMPKNGDTTVWRCINQQQKQKPYRKNYSST